MRTTINYLVGFLHARLDDDERDARLFHELDCPVRTALAPRACWCPCPGQLLGHVDINRSLVARHMERLERERITQGWPSESIRAFECLKAMALAYELHPDWPDTWYP
ncbi:DUF6221 family protein [Streptomyces longispororuber]|uniref:DUF6221 family protein n=1 Tax=Streptomyces longispororuber TaxID=68230 RepID=UPI00210AB291|nr:DUF6221 family protein [Streptomyces longispororuber]MCQ4211339.1 DUF6221 family protein [Streptomyces longispororuber]